MITGNLWFGSQTINHWPTFQIFMEQAIRPEMARRLLPLTTEVDDGPPVMARVNHGRWLIPCECGGGEFAWEEGLFMCGACYNGKHGHKIRRSVFPRARKKIEEIMLERPLENRNSAIYENGQWRAQGVAELQVENEINKAGLL